MDMAPAILWKLTSPQSALSKAVLRRFVHAQSYPRLLCCPQPVVQVTHVRYMVQMDEW